MTDESPGTPQPRRHDLDAHVAEHYGGADKVPVLRLGDVIEGLPDTPGTWVVVGFAAGGMLVEVMPRGGGQRLSLPRFYLPRVGDGFLLTARKFPGDEPFESVYEEVEALKQLVAIADRMFAEEKAKVQAESDAQYQAEFGHNGPSIASPLDSAGREYVFYRHRLGRRLGLPDAAISLGQVKP